jgi:hypothetical protein
MMLQDCAMVRVFSAQPRLLERRRFRVLVILLLAFDASGDGTLRAISLDTPR